MRLGSARRSAGTVVLPGIIDDVAYEMRDNHVQEPDEAGAADKAPEVEPGKIFEDAMSRIESITQEWAEVVRSAQR
ncbi:hypothetical protein ACI797_27525 [Geodermatophilus sp. SYSU D00691]